MFRSPTPRWLEIPPVQTGYELNPEQGLWSAIDPAGATNLITNPSLETNTTGWTASGSGSIARDSTYQRRGAYSLKVTPGSGTTDGAYATPQSLAANTLHAVGVDLLGARGISYQVALLDIPGNVYGQTVVRATGRWQRITTMARTKGAGTYRLYIRKSNSTSTLPFWVDGAQVEAGSFPTTYLDGDMQGVVVTRQDFFWNGTPHASTSTRSAQCRVGGRMVNLKDIGFRVMAILGLGLGGLINYTVPLAGGGSVYQGTNIGERQFSLVGTVEGASYQEVQRKRLALIHLLQPGMTLPDQPVALRYQPLEGGQPVGDEQEILALFKDGLSGQWDNHYQERLALQFTLFMPFVSQEEGQAGAALSYTTAIAATGGWDDIVVNDNGTWRTIAGGQVGGVGAEINAVLVDPGTGDIYIGGDFTSIGSLSATNVAKYNRATATWVVLGSVNPLGGGAVRQIKFGPDGYPYFFGNFSGGVRRWNTTTLAWETLGNAVTAVGTQVYSADWDQSGILYVGGGMTVAAGNIGNRIVKWNGSTWSAVGSGFSSDVVYGVGVSRTNVVYAQGGATLNPASVSYWNGTTWVSIGGPITNGNSVFYIADDGTLYVGSQDYIYWYNGVAWQSKRVDINAGTLWFRCIAPLGDGTAILGAEAGATVGTQYLYVLDLTSQAITKYDWYLPTMTSSQGTTGLSYSRGFLAVVGQWLQATTAAGLTAINYLGTAPTAPVFKFTGPGTLFSVRNYTTGDVIYFNLTLLANETAVLDLTQGAIQFYSNLRPDLLSTILPGSKQSTFQLLPGANNIGVFIGGTTSGATAASMTWRTTHQTLDAAIPMRLLP